MVEDIVRIIRKLAFGNLKNISGEVPDDAGDWGPKIGWRTLQAGEVEASLHKKPMMLVAHFPGCPVCNSLKNSVAGSEEIAQISSYFAMSLINELDVPNDKRFYPDDMGYVPRVMFYDHHGKLLDKYVNELGNPTKKYFYPNSMSLYKTMKQVAQEYKYNGHNDPKN